MHTKYGVPGSLGKGDPRAQVYQGRCSLLIIRAGQGGEDVGDPFDHLNEGFPTTYGTLWNHTKGHYLYTKYGFPGPLGKGEPRAQMGPDRS